MLITAGRGLEEGFYAVVGSYDREKEVLSIISTSSCWTFIARFVDPTTSETFRPILVPAGS